MAWCAFSPGWRTGWLLAALVGATAACERTQPPPIADGIAVEVAIDGAPSGTIDSAGLRKLPADYSDAELLAWRLGTLVSSYDAKTMDVALEDPAGERHELFTAGDTGGRVVVLGVNRAGMVRVAAVSPEDPFPPFHGRGGNRGRTGDPNRIRDVKRIVLTRTGKAAP